MPGVEVPQATVDALHKALNPAPVTPVAAPAVPPANPAIPAAPADEGRPRDEQGRFLPADPPPAVAPARPEPSQAERGLLAGLRAEREKRKALEVEIAKMRDARQTPQAPPVDRRADLLKQAPEESQRFWKDIADPVVRDTIREEVTRILEPHRPAIEAAAAMRAREVEVEQFALDLDEFVTDMALEGQSIDSKALVNTIGRFEKQYDISLGTTNRKKFENAVGMLGALPAPSKSVADKAAEAAAKAAQEAADKARAGGVSPGSAATIPPPDQREALQSTVRGLATKGDLRSIADIISKRIPKHPLLSGRPT